MIQITPVLGKLSYITIKLPDASENQSPDAQENLIHKVQYFSSILMYACTIIACLTREIENSTPQKCPHVTLYSK